MANVLDFPAQSNLGSKSLDRQLFEDVIFRLKSIREERGISVEQLSASMGINEQYILSVEASERSPSLGMLLVWLNRLNATLADISA